MKQAITINLVKSHHLFSKQMLDDCYFYEMKDGSYNLYSNANVLLAEGLHTEDMFSFTLGPFVWVVDDFVINPQQASGKWQTDIEGNLVPINPSNGEAEDEGSFSAQAGGHVPEETAASASAY